MASPLERLEQGLRRRGALAAANRHPRGSVLERIGTTVYLRLLENAYVVSVEHYRDDGGYGETVSRNEQSFDSLEAALAEIAGHGFSAEQLKF